MVPQQFLNVILEKPTQHRTKSQSILKEEEE